MKPRLGKVTMFDEERGLGTIVDDDGSEVPFHCKSIEGKCRVPQGARVTFVIVPGHLGRREAVGVTSITFGAGDQSPAGHRVPAEQVDPR